MRNISLEEHFQKACNKHPHLKLLESQWRFDEELIAKALQNVSSTFPHYSRHDASHSRQIIVNIERMLGKKVKNLTATDTWLILEAAYNHDIGMVITQKQIQDLDSEEFSLYVKDIISQPNNPLHRFATKWESDTANLPKGSKSNFFFHEYIQLIAEWYRKKHPENSAKIINNPSDEIGLNSPRNELLPKRLFGVLSKVCQAHGQSFKEVMKLPFAEAGMASEDCHPRYVACLLRMADLLDLDDNRFCPVMLHMCGEHLPKASQSHVDKHHSIKHFRLDSERIEVESECPSPEAYEVAFEWFKWLEVEYHQQTQNWDKIVPSKALGNLPTLTTPTVTIQEPFLILETGKKPSFRVDQAAILTLVRSTGLYTTKFESIRELLQNAVDATLIAIWMNHKAEITALNPTAPRLEELFKQYPISVDVDENLDDPRFITLRITDNGTGIDFETLKYMFEVGGTYKNKAKRVITDEMPIWYRPSGNFGIGFQSSFLIANKFTIKTKSRLTHKALKLAFSQNTDKPIIIKELPPSHIEYGSTFEIKIKIKKFPDTMQYRSSRDETLLSQRLNEYDFTQSGANLRCYEIIRICESIVQFNKESPIKINHAGITTSEKPDSFFCQKTNIVLKKLQFTTEDYGRLSTYFRGQKFDGFNYYFHCMHGSVDFYGYSAKDFLTYNRDKILPHIAREARDNVLHAVLSYIDQRFNKIPPDQKPSAAAFCLLYSKSPTPEIENQALEFEIKFSDGSSKSLNDVLSDIESGACNSLTTHSHSNDAPRNSTTLAQHFSDPAINLIIYFAKKRKLYHTIVDYGSLSSGLTYAWGAQDNQPITDELFRKVLSQEIGSNHGVGNRLLFPAWGKYRKLTIKATIHWAKVFSPITGYEDLMVLPCHFHNDHSAPSFHKNEELANWTYNHKKHDDVSLSEIHTLYDELSTHLENLISNR